MNERARAVALFFLGNATTGETWLKENRDRFGVAEIKSYDTKENLFLDTFNGRIDGDKIGMLLKSFTAPSDIDHVFLCGPGGLIEEGKRTLLSLGAAPLYGLSGAILAVGLVTGRRALARTGASMLTSQIITALARAAISPGNR